MRVSVRLLGAYREYLPANVCGSTYNLETPNGARIEVLLAQLPVPVDERYVVLINGRTPLARQILKEGDTIAVFPAMAGG